MYFTLPIIEILKVVWLFERELHEGGVLHHSSPLPLKGSDISPWRPTASPLLSVHNLMAAVTAQLTQRLIAHSAASQLPLFGDNFDIRVLSPFSLFLR